VLEANILTMSVVQNKHMIPSGHMHAINENFIIITKAAQIQAQHAATD